MVYFYAFLLSDFKKRAASLVETAFKLIKIMGLHGLQFIAKGVLFPGLVSLLVVFIAVLFCGVVSF